MNEKLEKLIVAQHREKQLEHELKSLTRSERTHRLLVPVCWKSFFGSLLC